ncbi:MAG: hypothetical protein NC342_01860 [Pseudoflavonifractor sp.]|nr:hypothetical protein [Alloprevotella sp.]MCM1116269.1 hypothetical protein [Pseudoflavonifractor sp.]
MLKAIARILASILPAVIAMALMLTAPFGVSAQEKGSVVYTDPYEGYNDVIFMDMDFEPNLLTPIVPDAEKAAIRHYMSAVAKKLKGPFEIELMRDGEVMVLTIPTDRIFLPGDTLLDESVERVFKPLLPMMSSPTEYKVIAAIHTDDTGNARYQEEFSQKRCESLNAFISELIDDGLVHPDIVFIPYAIGGDDPVTDNDTWRHRAQNRRLELYFIPGPSLIEKAHKETLQGADKSK